MNAIGMDVVFLLSHIPNPRINKRIHLIKDVMMTSVVCIRRKSSDIWEQHHMDVPHHIFLMDVPNSSQLLKRVGYSFSFATKSIKILNNYRPKSIYVSGFDSLIIACIYALFRKVKIIYEVADLREVFLSTKRQFISNFKTKLIKAVERICFLKIQLLVITSELFFERYFCRLVKQQNALFIPNIPDFNAFERYQKKESGIFTVGFIGGLRYLRQMKMLVDAAEVANVAVFFAGAGGTFEGMKEIQEYCLNKQYVTFSGKYNYATEIAALYSSVDCVFAVYDADNPNVQIALPNKLYESIYCNLPIIVAANTYLSQLVLQWGVGIPVDHKDKNGLINVLQKLSTDKMCYQKISNACETHKHILDANFYNKQLLSLLVSIVNKKSLTI